MGRKSNQLATRRELREAFGADVVKLLNSHADSITDLVRAHQHEIHMRMKHVTIVETDLDAFKRLVRELQAEIVSLQADVRALKGLPV